MGLTWLGTLTHTEHDVDYDQFEPGIPADEQARQHELDFVLMNWDLSAGLGINEWLEVEVRLPVRLIAIEATFRDEAGAELPEFPSIHHRDENLFGIGDLSASLRVSLIERKPGERWSLNLRTGLSFPTGGTEENPFVRGRRGKMHQHMFFGSGTLDPMGGLETAYAFEDWTLLGWASVRASFYENEHGYRGPGQVAGGVSGEAGFGLEDWRFQLGPEVFRETPATWSGEAAKNSGRTDIVGMAGVRYTPSPSWQFSFQARVPWTVSAEGGQLSTPFLAQLGVTYSFSVWDAQPASTSSTE